MVLFIQFIALLLIIVSTTLIYRNILAVRQNVSCNTVMLATMTLSTANGLIMGTTLAFTHSFSLNCILSMIIGISTGLILGILYNVMTTIEGIIGGVMGGLMGAMLGAMLKLSYIYIITAILLIILGIVTMLLIKHIQHESQTQPHEVTLPIEQRHLQKLTVGFIAFCVILFSGILVGTNLPLDADIDMQTEDTNHH